MAPTASSTASTAPTRTPTKRGRYSTMTIEKKAAIIREVESGRSQAEVARESKISKQTVSDYIRNKTKIKKAAEKSTGSRQKNVSKGSHPKPEEALHTWLNATVAKRVPVSGDLLKRKAETLALQMKITNFKFSDGWLRNFKKRYDLAFKKMCGKSGAIDSTIVTNYRAERLHALLRQYSPDDTFNC
ncbi:hypothetical protein HPB47_005270 [Ixodes persulcatus]|uniref:Uncharacterized protein n=1 Tax=Ixodes persulcatus TaxID=34615 RepID=A0AC60PDE6_IXOPE|nr:hypothetical protein HPB47_005270 [Ixodes persulcatus]